MFKQVADEVWAFDSEWVPDAVAGRVLYDLPESMPEQEVFQHMWKEAGASEENPRPFLKLVQCRLVSIAFVRRFTAQDGSIAVELRSRPKVPTDRASCSEENLIHGFLLSVGMRKPQIVGYNSYGSDLPILYQRAVIHGLQAAAYCERPDKPWLGKDYFARSSDWNIDLLHAIGSRGAARPSLRELAHLSGIPAKIDGFDGADTPQAWLDGKIDDIVRYNEQDALTTYLVWLRIAHFGGHFSQDDYAAEQNRLRMMLEGRAADPANGHLARYLEIWNHLSGRSDQPVPSSGATH